MQDARDQTPSNVVLSTRTKVALLVAANILVLLVAEGLAGWLLTLNHIRQPVQLGLGAVRTYSQYDADLGWAMTPNTRVEDLYGPGASVTVNSQGFRGTREYSDAVPAGLQRIVCSGDSFTMGYGVGDHESWCFRLSTLDRSLEPLNMGQSGYGVGQAYLWYMRDGRRFDHNVHLFAFITNDFARMQRDNYEGYGKPLVHLDDDGELVVSNVPAPERLWRSPSLATRVQRLEALSTYRLLERLIGRIDWRPAAGEASDSDPRAVASAVFASLAHVNQQKDSTLVLVYLPREEDFLSPETDEWRQWLEQESSRLGIAWIDVVKEMRGQSVDDWNAMFSQAHYSVEGNRFVAGVIYRALESSGLIADDPPGIEHDVRRTGPTVSAVPRDGGA